MSFFLFTYVSFVSLILLFIWLLYKYILVSLANKREEARAWQEAKEHEEAMELVFKIYNEKLLKYNKDMNDIDWRVK